MTKSPAFSPHFQLLKLILAVMFFTVISGDVNYDKLIGSDIELYKNDELHAVALKDFMSKGILVVISSMLTLLL